jgi:hypothetical protein
MVWNQDMCFYQELQNTSDWMRGLRWPLAAALHACAWHMPTAALAGQRCLQSAWHGQICAQCTRLAGRTRSDGCPGLPAKPHAMLAKEQDKL